MINLTDKICDYLFVSLELFFKTGIHNESNCDVILLVDEDNWILDYKIKWKKLSLTEFTTASHYKKNIKKSFKLKFREKLLNILGLKSIPNFYPNHRKKYINLNKEQINNVNTLFDSKWNNQSFSNIDYVITGSNATGQGNPKNSSFYLKHDNKKFNIGFLFQSLRLTFHKMPLNEFKEIWEDYFKNENNYQKCNFNEWLNKNHKLRIDFEYFNQKLSPTQQKSKIKQIKNKYCPLRRKYEEIYDLTMKYRQCLYNKLKKKKEEFTNNFWNKQFNDGFFKIVHFAHIKPVSEIKKEAIANKFDKKILENIKDENNILPLDPNTHNLFDKHEICWSLESGDIFFRDKQIPDNNVREDFLKIPIKSLNKIHDYLSWNIKFWNK